MLSYSQFFTYSFTRGLEHPPWMHILSGWGGSQCSQADLASNPGSALDFLLIPTVYCLFFFFFWLLYLASLGLSYSMRDLVP